MISLMFGLMIIAIFVVLSSDITSIYESLNRSKLAWGYLISIFIVQSLTNIMTIGACNYSNYVSIFLLSTLIPFISMIVFSYIILLDMTGLKFSYWLNPFANTFGYFAAIVNGLRDVTDSLFIQNTDGLPADLSEVLRRIHTDSTLIINTLTMDTIDPFIEKMNDILKTENRGENLKRLRELVTMKHDIAFVIWIGLVAMLSYSIGNNYILSNNCRPSKQDKQAWNKVASSTTRSYERTRGEGMSQGNKVASRTTRSYERVGARV